MKGTPETVSKHFFYEFFLIILSADRKSGNLFLQTRASGQILRLNAVIRRVIYLHFSEPSLLLSLSLSLYLYVYSFIIISFRASKPEDADSASASPRVVLRALSSSIDHHVTHPPTPAVCCLRGINKYHRNRVGFERVNLTLF